MLFRSEAASTGLPIVGINHQGVGDYVPRAAGHLEQLDSPAKMADGMAAAIVELCSDRDRFRSASAAARDFAECHSSDAARSRIERYYRLAIDLHRMHC